MSLTIIAAVADNRAIGRAGDLAFHISADLKRFKALTMGHTVIMGRKTFESLPGGPLLGRRNIVVTSHTDMPCETASSLEKAIEMAGNDAFIIGGGQIYSQAMPFADKLEITRIFAPADGADTFFPPYETGWVIAESGPIETDSRVGVQYQFQTLIHANETT